MFQKQAEMLRVQVANRSEKIVQVSPKIKNNMNAVILKICKHTLLALGSLSK